jgi:hypothetical protein
MQHSLLVVAIILPIEGRVEEGDTYVYIYIYVCMYTFVTFSAPLRTLGENNICNMKRRLVGSWPNQRQYICNKVSTICTKNHNLLFGEGGRERGREGLVGWGKCGKPMSTSPNGCRNPACE